MGSEREHRRAHERAMRSQLGEQTNTNTKRHISPLPNGTYSLFTFENVRDREYTFVRTGVCSREAEDWLYAMNEVAEKQTQADRIKAGGRTQPLTPVELAFFDRPDRMVKPQTTKRAPISIDPSVRERLRSVLTHDDRFHAIGYSEFIARALDALGCEG